MVVFPFSCWFSGVSACRKMAWNVVLSFVSYLFFSKNRTQLLWIWPLFQMLAGMFQMPAKEKSGHIFRLLSEIIMWYISYSIGSMGLVYLPTWMVDFDGKCRYIHHGSHGSYGYPYFKVSHLITTLLKATAKQEGGKKGLMKENWTGDKKKPFQVCYLIGLVVIGFACSGLKT